MDWIFTEEEKGICWIKDVEDGAARSEEKRKITEKFHRCSEIGRADGWCDRGRCYRRG